MSTVLLAGIAAAYAVRARRPKPPLAFAKGSASGIWQGVGVTRTQHLSLLGAGFVNGVGYACIYLAERTLSGGTTAVLCATSPIFTVLLARLFGLEPLRWQRLIGMAVGFLGVSLLFADGLRLSRDHFYAMLIVGGTAAFLWPLYGALLKRYAQELPPLQSTSYFLFYTGLTLLGLSLLRREPLPNLGAAPLAAHLGFLYLTLIGSVLAWTVYIWLLKRLELSVVSTLGLLQPVVALGIDLVLDEAQLQPRGYLGTALVLAGMALSTIKFRRESGQVLAPGEEAAPAQTTK